MPRRRRSRDFIAPLILKTDDAIGLDGTVDPSDESAESELDLGYAEYLKTKDERHLKLKPGTEPWRVWVKKLSAREVMHLETLALEFGGLDKLGEAFESPSTRERVFDWISAVTSTCIRGFTDYVLETSADTQGDIETKTVSLPRGTEPSEEHIDLFLEDLEVPFAVFGAAMAWSRLSESSGNA